VLLELVVNAVEALDGGTGCIDVESGCSLLDASEVRALTASDGLEAGPCAWVEVRDDGPGIAPDACARLFERGFSTKGDGRGHGLCEVRELLARQGGGLRVSSRPGEGAAFRILVSLGSAPS